MTLRIVHYSLKATDKEIKEYARAHEISIVKAKAELRGLLPKDQLQVWDLNLAKFINININREQKKLTINHRQKKLTISELIE